MTPPDPWPAVAERLAQDATYLEREVPDSRCAADLRAALTRITDQAAKIDALRARAEAAERRVGVLSDGLIEAFLAGFDSSGEGWNGEYPFEGQAKDSSDWAVIRLRASVYVAALASGSADRGGEG